MVTNQDSNERACDVVLLDEWLLMKRQIICKLVMVLLRKSSADLGFIKSVQNELQNNSHCCLNKCTWTSVNIWISVVDTFLDRIVNGDKTWICHWEPESKWQCRKKTPKITQQESSIPTLQEKWCSQFLWLTGPSSGTLEGHNNKQCSLQKDAHWQTKACSFKQALRTTVGTCCDVAWQWYA